jgi:hypothetical protein
MTVVKQNIAYERDISGLLYYKNILDNPKKLIEYIKTAYINLLSSGSTINADVIDNLLIILNLLNEALSTKQNNNEAEVFKHLVKKLKDTKRCGITSFGSSKFQPMSKVAAGVYTLADINAAESLLAIGQSSSDKMPEELSSQPNFSIGVNNPSSLSDTSASAPASAACSRSSLGARNACHKGTSTAAVTGSETRYS